MDKSLRNKKILISAGASGIGWATAKVCLSKGAVVYICDIEPKYLNKVKKSSNGEYVLTDIISLCVKDGSKVGLVSSSEEDLLGINDREDLSKAELIIQNRLRIQYMKNGVTMLDPRSVYIDASSKIQSSN